MQTIRKFPLLISTEPQTVAFPNRSQIVNIGRLGEDACLWVLSHTEDADTDHTFALVGDDDKVSSGYSYVGSYIHPEDARLPDCVVRATPIHVFEVNPRSIPPSPQ